MTPEQRLESWYLSVTGQLDIAVVLGFGATAWDVLRRSAPKLRVAAWMPEVPDDATAAPDGCIMTDSVIELRRWLAGTYRTGDRVEFMVRDGLESAMGSVIRAVLDGRDYAMSLQTTAAHYSVRWAKDGMRSLHRLAGRVPINRMPDALQSVPGVVIGAGPSLTAALPHLERIKGKACLAATNSAMGPLSSAGIEPDMMFVAEHKPQSVASLEGIDNIGRTACAPIMHVHRSLWDIGFAATYPCIAGAGGTARWLAGELDVPLIAGGGSVSTIAVSALQHLGCDPIILVGQDCALAGSRMYADGVRHDNWDSSQQRHQVPAWGGRGTVDTIMQLRIAQQWLEHRAASLAPDQHHLINATGAGARIHGWREAYIRDVASHIEDGAPSVDVMATLASVAATSEPIGGLVPMLEAERDRVAFGAERAAELAAASSAMARCFRVMQRSISPTLGAASIPTMEQQRDIPAAFRIDVMRDVAAKIVSRAATMTTEIDAAIERLQSMEMAP